MPRSDRWTLLGLAACLPAALVLASLGATGAAGALRLGFASLGPGFVAATLWGAHRPEPFGWRIALGLALSPVLVAAPAAALSFGAGASLAGAAGGCVLVSWLAACGVLFARRRSASAGGPPAPRARDVWLALLPTATMVALALWVQLPEGTRISYHGLFHADVAAQLATGRLPPENPAAAGMPLRYYWMFHWWLAALHELDGFSFLVHSPLVNLASLAIYVAAGHVLLLRFCTPPLAALGAAALGFAMNLLFPLFFLAGALASDLPVGAFHFPFEVLSLGAPAGDPRLVTLFAKFLNSNGFPLGLALFAALVVELAPAEGRPPPRKPIVFLLLCGTLLFHSAAALAAYASLGLAWASVSVPKLRGASLAALARANLPLAGVFVAALAAAAPYLGATLLEPGSGGRPLGGALHSIAYNAGGVAVGATALLPALSAGAVLARRDATARFLVVATGVLLASGLLLTLPDGNQYKLVQLASFPGGALLLLLAGRARRAGVAFAGVAALAAAAHGVTAWAYLASGMSRVERWAGDGAYLAIPGRPAEDRALHWLRAHTPPDAVVVARPLPRGSSPITAVSGRGVFVMESLAHFRAPDHDERLRLARSLLAPDGPAGPAADRIAGMLDRPLYVLLVRSDPGLFYDAVVEKLERAPEALERVHGDDDFAIYAIRGRR